MDTEATPVRKVGRWTLKRKLGEGQFGTTWIATDSLGRRAALKRLAEPPGAEALALASIAHPSVPRLVDSGGAPNPFLAMELVNGQPLEERIARGPVRVHTAAHIAGQLFDALDTVHRSGIVHGDIKPENVAVGQGETPPLWVLDFGMVGHDGGTRDYAAPERLQGLPPTPAADVYAAGLVLWELVHGTLPDADGTANDRLRARLEGMPEPTQGPPWLRELLGRLLHHDPEQRPSARSAVETLANAGYHAALPTGPLLKRRLRTADLGRHRVNDRVLQWEVQGGALAISSAPRVGRSHQLTHCATRLAAKGEPYVLITPTTRSWGAIEAALMAPTVPGSARPLPNDADVLVRAEKCIDALVSRAGSQLRVLVDDLDQLDPGSRMVVNALIRRGGMPILATVSESADTPMPTLHVEPLDVEQIERLVRALLGGEGDIHALLGPLQDATGGRPAAVVDAVEHAISSGILQRPTWRWTLDTSRLGELADAQWSDTLPPLSDAATRIGGLLGLFEDRIPLARLASLSDVARPSVLSAIEELVGAGIVRHEHGHVRVESLAWGVQLAAAHPDPPAAHGRLFDRLSEEVDSDVVRRAWHAAHAGRLDASRALADEAMVAASTRDPGTAVRLAQALHGFDPTQKTTEFLAQALVEHGQAERAAQIGGAWLNSHPATPDQLELALILARALGGLTGREQDAREALHLAESLAGSPPPPSLVIGQSQWAFRTEDHHRVLELTQDLQSTPRPQTAHELVLLSLRAQSLHAIGQTAAAVQVLEVSPDGLRHLPEFAVLQGVRGRLLWHAGRVREAAHVLDAAAALPVGAVSRAKMANNAALALYDSGDVPGALDSWERAIGLFERLDLHVDLVRALTNVVVGYKDAARWGRAIEAGERAHRLAISLNLPELAAMCLGNLGDVALWRSQFQEAESLYGQCEAIAQAEDLHSEQIELGRRRAELAVLQRHPNAGRLARAADQAATDAGDTAEALRARALTALCAARSGQRVDASTLLREVLSTLKANGAARALAEVRVWAAEAWLELGDTEACIEELDRALAYADEAGLTALRARGDAVRAKVPPPPSAPEESEVERFLVATAQLARHQDVETLFRAAAVAMLGLTGVERAFVLHEREGHIQVAAYSGPQTSPDSEPSSTVVGRALRTGRPVMVTDLSEREDLREAESIMALDLRFAACVPLRSTGRVVGAMYVDGPLIMERGLQRVSRVLSFLTDHVAAALENVRAHRAARQRAEEISEVGHDLRGMLLVIEAYVHDVLLDATEKEDRTQVRALQDVLLATDRVQRLSDGLIRRYHTRDQSFDLTALVEECMRWAAADSRHRRIALIPDLDEAIEVEGDPDQLNRAVAHLLRVATHHAQAGGTITASVTEDLGDAIVQLATSGPPMTDDQLSRLFTPDHSDPNSVDCSIGLAGTRKIAQAHSGSVEARNGPNEGVEFVMRVRVG